MLQVNFHRPVIPTENLKCRLGPRQRLKLPDVHCAYGRDTRSALNASGWHPSHIELSSHDVSPYLILDFFGLSVVSSSASNRETSSVSSLLSWQEN